jgi:hypothetical protein
MENDNANMGQPGPNSQEGNASPPALAFDAGDYISGLDDFDLTAEEAAELLGTLFAIMRAFVELGFQHDVCGQVFGETPGLLSDGVNWSEPQHDQTAP